ncbi:MAG: nuclear transport factor 2 family protein [Microbacteriaceae bacterium]
MRFPDTLIDTADLSAFSPDQLQIWDEQKAMYAGFLTGDRARTDAHIAAECTIWDSGVAALARGMVEFNALRAARSAEGPRVRTITAHQPIIDVWGDTAAGRHVLEVDYVDAAAPPELIRVSAVWRRRAAGWMLVHSHEDLFPTV